MCFTYLQENSSSQTNGLKRRLSQESIYLYLVLHLLVAARFAFQFWKHVWFAFYICNMLMFTDPDSIVLLFSSSLLFTVKLLSLLLWIHTGRGLIALDTFYDFHFISTSFSFPYVTNIYQIYCILAALFSHIASIQNTLQYLRFRILHLYGTCLNKKFAVLDVILFFYRLFRKGGRNHPSIFSFLPCLISIGRTFRFGAHFKYIHSKPFLLVFFVLVLFFFFLFVYLVYIGDGAKALWFVKKDRRTRSTGSWLRRKQEENMSRDMLSRSLTDRRCYHKNRKGFGRLSLSVILFSCSCFLFLFFFFYLCFIHFRICCGIARIYFFTFYFLGLFFKDFILDNDGRTFYSFPCGQCPFFPSLLRALSKLEGRIASLSWL